MQTFTIQDIENEFFQNKSFYDEKIQSIKKNIQGRSCHFKVILLTLLHKFMKIHNYLEIGVHNGTSMSCLVNGGYVNKSIGIDLFEDTIDRYKHDSLSYQRSHDNISKNNLFLSNLIFIKGNSFHPLTVSSVQDILKEDLLDVFFIDGLHTYDGVKNDFFNYSPFVKQFGLIILDDYEPNYPDILRFVKEHIENNQSYKIIGVFEKNELIIQKLL